MRAAIYIRISTHGQEAGTSLDTQEAECRAYAGRHDLAVAHVFREVYSGVEYFDRPAMTELRRAMRERDIEHVVFYVADRLSRGGIYAALLHSEACDASVQLHEVYGMGRIPMDQMGEMMMYLKGSQGKGEHGMIRERMMRSKRARAASGKLLPASRPLYGYRWIDDRTRLEEDPDTAPHVRRVFLELLAGKGTRIIARGLMADGIPTPTERVKMRKDPAFRPACRWNLNTIATMLHHPGYAGRAVAWHGEIELPEGTIPALVSQEVWDAAQARLIQNRKEATRNNRRPQDALLRAGFVRCGTCGRSLSPRWNGTMYSYYCQGKTQNALDCEGACIGVNKLDQTVWARVEAILTEPDLIACELERLRAADPTQGDLDSIDASIRRAEQQQSNLVRAIAMLDDPDAVAPLAYEVQALTQRIRDARIERQGILDRQDAWQEAQRRMGDITIWCHRVATNLTTLTYEERRDVLRLLGIEVKVFRKHHAPRYDILANIPLDWSIETQASSRTRTCRGARSSTR